MTSEDPSFGTALNLNPSFNVLRICLGRVIAKYELGDSFPVNAGLIIVIISSQCIPPLPYGHRHAYPEIVLVHRPPFSPQMPGEQASPT